MNAQSPGELSDLRAAVLETLRQGERLLTEISDESYTTRLSVAFNASIGGHYRHCLDHFRTLFAAAGAGDLNYDHRLRGTLVETDRHAALAATRELLASYASLDPVCLVRPLTVTCKTSFASSGSQAAVSTVGREVMYSVAHAVHHYAVIGVMGGIMGLALPAGFGVAPSTLKHQAETAAAA
jgi:hypothetical protein